jgi:hypothetical protein
VPEIAEDEEKPTAEDKNEDMGEGKIEEDKQKDDNEKEAKVDD